MGTRCDMIFRDLFNNTEEPREYGASETGSLFEGEHGVKLMTEGYLKLPKTLKDMLGNLYEVYPEAKKDCIETIGFVHAGLFSQVLCIDRPSPFVTRVTRLALTTISAFIQNFDSSVLPALYASYVVREIFKKIQHACTPVVHFFEASTWLTTCLDVSNYSSTIPSTASSNETSKKHKSY